MTNAAPTAIRQRLDTLKPQVRAVANRHGTSDRRVYGSIATGSSFSALEGGGRVLLAKR
jgi:glutamate mutase epsilon subunit